ncbi:MAG: sigma-54-dependent transcriptional regulator [Bryobacteraceae bacterium]
MKQVLVAEDERAARISLVTLLEGAAFRVIVAQDGHTALLLLLTEEPEAALLDIRMPGLDGLEVLRKAREGGSDTALIVMTAHGDSTTAIEAMKLGAFDYVEKPIDFDKLLPQLRRAIEHRKLARRAFDETAGSGEPAAKSPAMVGHSPAMQHVYKLIGQVAASDATVLVRGESGTGKELVVNAIHHNSTRARGPLVKVNCASIPETLLESELFGHEKGAFTNALYRRVGRFEEANRGTLFLDEIGELAPALQAKLLRAIQERTIERLGSNIPIRVDLRLITATARDLEQAVSDGRFREDLYYRLNVVTIALPPLRERRQDIPPLVDFFLHRNGRPVSMTPSALQTLCAYHWPGNVRELENTVERARVLAPGGIIDEAEVHLQRRPESTGISWAERAPIEDGWKKCMATLEKYLVERAMALAGGNKSKAAGTLQIHRRLLYEKLREYGLKADGD